jgi:transposase
MRFYPQQHPFPCGIDLHARTLYLCILHQDGAILVHRNMPAGPEPFLKAVAPYREDLVVWVACIFPWDWLADLWARAGMPCVRGHALDMKAIHGGKATNDTIDSQNMAVLRRGGMLPPASVSPAALRATRDVLRPRMPLMRTRAALLAHVQQTHSQDNLPGLGKNSAYQAQRDGLAERLPAPAGQTSLAGDLALLGHSDHRLHAVAFSIVHPAKQHDPQTLSRLPSGPGIGTILRLVLLDAIQTIARFPRGQDVVSSCRLVQGAKASAGQRDGPAGAKSGHASLQWACSAAAALFLCTHPAGQKSLARFENKHGQGTALTVLAQQLARAVSSM